MSTFSGLDKEEWLAGNVQIQRNSSWYFTSSNPSNGRRVLPLLQPGIQPETYIRLVISVVRIVAGVFSS